MRPTLYPTEPAAGPWRVASVDDVVRMLLPDAGEPQNRPRILAIDGCGGAGKTTVAAALAASVPQAAVVHTDDVAWHHSFFGWDDLLIEGVLAPLHRGEAVSYRPAAWSQRGRDGAIEVSSGVPLVIVEGTGAARREVTHLMDRTVWIQTDLVEARRRCLAREGDSQAARDFWEEWMREELPFMSEQRPWERADVIVAGTPTVPCDPTRHLVIAAPPAPA